jgi:hypothetical protein
MAMGHQFEKISAISRALEILTCRNDQRHCILKSALRADSRIIHIFNFVDLKPTKNYKFFNFTIRRSVMKNFLVLSLLLGFFSTNADAIEKPVSYFSCKIKETVKIAKKTKKVNVTVKFAVAGLDVRNEEGELLTYPGADEDYGSVYVKPMIVRIDKKERYTLMSNLNGQGGDLQFEGGNIKLWGDGDGYQFTELVVWDVDGEVKESYEGYVRDYGYTYKENEETFKQFIKCKRSSELL